MSTSRRIERKPLKTSKSFSEKQMSEMRIRVPRTPSTARTASKQTSSSEAIRTSQKSIRESTSESPSLERKQMSESESPSKERKQGESKPINTDNNALFFSRFNTTLRSILYAKDATNRDNNANNKFGPNQKRMEKRETSCEKARENVKTLICYHNLNLKDQLPKCVNMMEDHGAVASDLTTFFPAKIIEDIKTIQDARESVYCAKFRE